ncbi:nucleotide-diphospho-sugar transferase, partial [Mycena epipterygia]
LFFSGAGTAAYDPAAHARPSSSSAHENKTLYSIIVPTYHERANIRPLVTRVFTALPDPAIVELVIVDDDSRDGTDNVVAELREEGFNVVLIVRTKEEQERGGKGLSGAVLRGFEEARGESLVVMDADLQHPPTALPALFSALDDPATPFALGTRYAPGVEMDQNWPLYRRVISWGARSLARPLTSASDPMTGFFGIRKELFLHSAPLTPTGFKIGLELLLKAPIPRGGVKEVPFSFGVREVGESKLSGKVMIRYVGQLWNLYWWAWGIFFPLAL